MSGIKLPLTLSVAGHAVCLALLVLFLSEPRSGAGADRKGGIEVVFEPAAAKAGGGRRRPEETPPPEPNPSGSAPARAAVPAAEPPPEPAPVTAAEPPPPAPEAPVAASEPPPPPPPQKHCRQETAKACPAASGSAPADPGLPSEPAAATPRRAGPSAPPQTAMAATPVPAPVPSPEASAGYRALLSAWLESHKRYPDAARQRGEEGRAVLRFSVDRSGRVLDYAVTSSSGYPDLDQSIEEMMRGATLPPFPAGMPQPEMQVSVTIRFSLRR